jgi:HSP20 family molecular chaperone IbpA
VIETDQAFKVVVDTPGMDSGDISITMDNGVLTIAGKKRTEVEEKDRVRCALGLLGRRGRGAQSIRREAGRAPNADTRVQLI